MHRRRRFVDSAKERRLRSAALLALQWLKKAQMTAYPLLASEIWSSESITEEASATSVSSFFFFFLFGEAADLNDVYTTDEDRPTLREEPFFSGEKQRSVSLLFHSIGAPQDLQRQRVKPNHPSCSEGNNSKKLDRIDH
jgi:hypothetical protein